MVKSDLNYFHHTLNEICQFCVSNQAHYAFQFSVTGKKINFLCIQSFRRDLFKIQGEQVAS